MIYAGSKVREVAGDELALKVARDAFDWLEAHAHDPEHGGYFEALTPRRHADRRPGRPSAPHGPTRPTGWASTTASSR